MDFGALVDKLKDNGLDVAEDAAVVVVNTVFDWAAEEAVKSENKYDDLLLAVLPVVKSQVLGLVDKIDGEDDPNL